MILQALYDHYQVLLEDEDSGIAKPGYSVAKVSHAIVLSQEGELLSIISIMRQEGRKAVPRSMLVPLQKKRANGVNPYFLCDKGEYILGLALNDEKEMVPNLKYYLAFRELQKQKLAKQDDPDSKAVLKFLERWNPEEAQKDCKKEDLESALSGSMIVFKVDGKQGFVHENRLILNAWDKTFSQTSTGFSAQCLVTGEYAPIARLHPNIKNVPGAQTAGAAIVSFNKESMASYNKVQSYNAPVSEKAAEAYGTVLNYLLTLPQNNVGMADTRIVFWAEKLSKKEESLLAWFLNPTDEVTDTEDVSSVWKPDKSTVNQAKSVLDCVRRGAPVSSSGVDLNPDVRFFMLGLAPNMSRLSIRFWHVGTFGDFVQRIGQHYCDMEIVGNDRFGAAIPIKRLLLETAVLRDSKRIPPLLGGAVMRAVLTGQEYPQSLYSTVISRIRADQDTDKVKKVNGTRAAIIKACGLRRARIAGNKEKEALYTVGLNESNTNTAYRLGRLFALLEKAQSDAIQGANATIRDRYFGAASATPAKVFPVLLRLSQHHISKAEYGKLTDRKIQDVMNGLDGFPSHLDLEDQGLFVLGYYHQKQAIYTKSEGVKKEEETENDSN